MREINAPSGPPSLRYVPPMLRSKAFLPVVMFAVACAPGVAFAEETIAFEPRASFIVP